MSHAGPPQHFCWTKFGTEAGEPIESILQRKEEERQGNAGVFLWGIGNSIGPSLLRLLELEPSPQVLFTPMRTKPAAKDVAPDLIGRWSTATGLDGADWDLPACSTVTSGTGPGQPVPRRHYALVCERTEPLERDEGWWFDDAALTNLRSGARIGGSQVTSVVQHRPTAARRPRYVVTMQAALVWPYFVTLGGWQQIERDVAQPVSGTA